MIKNYKELKVLRPLQNPTIPAALKKRVGFSEVTGGLRRAWPSRRALSFRNLSIGETAAPSFSEENAEGVKHPPLISYWKIPAREPWNLRKCPPYLLRYESFKARIVNQKPRCCFPEI